MRFLNIKLSIPDKEMDLNISLKQGLNTIQTGEALLKEILPELPLITLYGRGSGTIPPWDILRSDTHKAVLDAEKSGEQIRFIYENGELKHDPAAIPGLISFDYFTLYSYFTPEHPEGVIDPVFNNAALKQFLISCEPDSEANGNMHHLDEVITIKEKEISELRKKRELLELKKRKKEKLVKEISGSERELGKLRRKRESYASYRRTLTDILELMQEGVKISSKMVNLKKDIIEIRETSEKREALQKEIDQRFPQFTSGMIELIPDLDRLQGEFNSIRDINEEMEKFDSDRRRKISLSLKAVTAGLVFAFVSMMFILFKSISLTTFTGILLGTISSLLVLLSAATGYYLYHLMKESYPVELLQRKNNVEAGLLQVFTSENFPHRNFGTGELYEYLFQYFEDFLIFRELQNELSGLNKGYGSRASLEEREDKLRKLTVRMDAVEKEIAERISSLDQEIHPAPGTDMEEIKNLIPEIDEMIAEIARDEERKDSIARKIENEAQQYESGERSAKTIDDNIAVIESGIEKLKKEIEQVSFMHKVYEQTSGEWFSARLPLISEKCAAVYCRILNEKSKGGEIAASVRGLIASGSSSGFTDDEIKLTALSMKLAIDEIIQIPHRYPLILRDPCTFFKPEFADKIKKILLELSEKRQVVIFTSKSDSDLAGNLINI